MPAEKKSGKNTKKIEVILSAATHRQLKKACKDDGTSISQRVRDLVQKDLKGDLKKKVNALT